MAHYCRKLMFHGLVILVGSCNSKSLHLYNILYWIDKNQGVTFWEISLINSYLSEPGQKRSADLQPTKGASLMDVEDEEGQMEGEEGMEDGVEGQDAEDKKEEDTGKMEGHGGGRSDGGHGGGR